MRAYQATRARHPGAAGSPGQAALSSTLGICSQCPFTLLIRPSITPTAQSLVANREFDDDGHRRLNVPCTRTHSSSALTTTVPATINTHQLHNSQHCSGQVQLRRAVQHWKTTPTPNTDRRRYCCECCTPHLSHLLRYTSTTHARYPEPPDWSHFRSFFLAEFRVLLDQALELTDGRRRNGAPPEQHRSSGHRAAFSFYEPSFSISVSTTPILGGLPSFTNSALPTGRIRCGVFAGHGRTPELSRRAFKLVRLGSSPPPGCHRRRQEVRHAFGHRVNPRLGIVPVEPLSDREQLLANCWIEAVTYPA